DLQRFGDRAKHGGDLVGDDLPQLLDIARDRVAALGKALANTRRHPGPKVGGDQRLFDPVEIFVVEPRLAGETSEIFAQPLRRALEAAEQPLAPARAAHAAILSAIIRSPSRAARRTGTMLPGVAGAARVSAANVSPCPVRPSRSTSIDARWPLCASIHA